MKRRLLALVATLLAATASAAEVKIDGRTYNLPDGFTLEKVAGPPLVDRPIVADFDERGRLYVADSSGSNERVKVQLEKKPHRVVRLEDVDGDGRYDKSTVFADRMMFPEGAMWFEGSLYVSAPPQIWKLTDTDDDGVADRREVWFDGQTLGGCANDLHGPYRGPDGWIYWCKGGFERQTFDWPGRGPVTSRAAHIFRARPDGSGREPIMTGGMDNPVDVVFTPGGEPIFTTTFLQHPAEGRRDGLIHAVYGGVYGKVHDVIDGHPRTGPDVMPVMTHLGPAAPCGLTRYESDAFGPEFKDNLFACQFNLRKVSRHVLIPDGSTFKTADSDLVATDDHDFHPTDVIEDADGSLLVVDTGGWYKLCCPTSQLEKPDVLGAIYRVRKERTLPLDDPRGLRLDWDRPSSFLLAARLYDGRPAVRRRAIEALARLGRESLPALRLALAEPRRPELRGNVIWALARLDDPEARALIRTHLSEPASIRAVGLSRDREAMKYVIARLQEGKNDVGSDEDVLGRAGVESRLDIAMRLAGLEVVHGPYRSAPLVTGPRHAIAATLGRIGDKSAVPAILETLGGPLDRVLDHALTYALIEIADPDGTAGGLASDKPAIRRAAMIALDQMPRGDLKPGPVLAELASAEAANREAAAWVAGHHPEWGRPMAGWFRERLAAKPGADSDRESLAHQLATLAKAAEVRDLIGAVLVDPASTLQVRRVALRAIAEASPKALPAKWAEGLASSLASDDSDLAAQAVATVGGLGLKEDKSGLLAPRLLAFVGRATVPDAIRLDALAAVPGGPGTLSAETFELARKGLDPAGPVAPRLLAAEALAKAKLDASQLGTVADALASAGPLEIDRLLPAFAKSGDEAVGLRVVEALRRSPIRASLRADAIRPHLAKYGPGVQTKAEELYAELNVDASKQKARVEELLTTLPRGDVRRGQAVFNGSKSACLSCHAVGYVGGRVGPDLSKIGSVRQPRDLIESIVYPSASFVRSYEPVVVATRDGRAVSGVVRRDAAEGMTLATGPDKEERIARADIEEVKPGTVSVMPAGLDAQITPQELADLLAFLQSRK